MGGAAGTGGAAGRGGTTGAAGAGGAAGTGGAAGSGIDPDLVVWYQFNETSGTTAADSSGNARNGTLTNVGTGTATFSTANHVLNLASSDSNNGGYLKVPASLQSLGATTAITISTYVYIRTARNWQRVFDFGNSSTTGYAFFTTQEQTNMAPRFAITKTGNAAEQQISMTTPAALSTGAWHHIAVVLGTGSTYTGTLYIDKVAVGTNAAMTLRPSDLGATANNFVGKSQFPDPYFDGFIDDFRVYKRALTATEITALP
jgi:hypothetical protein